MAPRHYLEVTDLSYPDSTTTWVGPTEWPVLSSTCSIQPWGIDDSAEAVQREAFEFFRQYGSNPAESDKMLSLRCGGGKTCISIRAAYDLGYHFLIVAHTKEILENWKDELLRWTSLGESDIGEIVSGKDDRKEVTLALIQSLMAFDDDTLEEIGAQFGTVIFDEVHHLSGQEFSRVGNAFPGVRIGASATLDREDGLSWVFHSAIGTNLFFRELRRKKARVILRRIPVSDIVFDDNYARATTSLSESSQYLDALEYYIRQGYAAMHKQLVLSSRKELLHNLRDRLSDLDPGLNTSETKPRVRATNTHTKRINLSIDTFGKEGLNDLGLTQMHVITPVKDSNALLQMVGRLERGDKVMEAYFYAADNPMFLSTLRKTKTAFIMKQYYVEEG